ncbi:MAG: MraZ N-terminal domain containing protein [Spirochaetes bacterium]|nr:MraZ N-terminal domain containing protein [Spirochaetota bacterium]
MEKKSKKIGTTMYGVTKISSKGQIIIPADLRKDLGIKKGDTIYVMKNWHNDIVLLTLERMEEILSYGGIRSSIDD